MNFKVNVKPSKIYWLSSRFINLNLSLNYFFRKLAKFNFKSLLNQIKKYKAYHFLIGIYLKF